MVVSLRSFAAQLLFLGPQVWTAATLAEGGKRIGANLTQTENWICQWK